MVAAQRGHPFAGKTIAVPGAKIVAIEQARDHIVAANAREQAHLSLPQMSSDWRETANWVILAPDVGRLQIALVAAHRVIPITSEP